MLRCRGAKVQRCKGSNAKVQRCKGTKVLRWKGANVQSCKFVWGLRFCVFKKDSQLLFWSDWRLITKLSNDAYFQIVTDLIIASSVNQNLANTMLSLIIMFWLYMGTLPCMLVSTWLFLYNASLVAALAIINCQGLVQVSLTHQWSWIHECMSWIIRMICILFVTSLLILTMGQDFYQVSLLTSIKGWKWCIHQALNSSKEFQLNEGTFLFDLIGKQKVSSAGILVDKNIFP